MNFTSSSEEKFVASRSLHAWKKLNRCRAFQVCPGTYSNLFLEVDAVLLLINLKFFILPLFSSPAKCELNGSNDTFLETDTVRNYGIDSRSSAPK